MTKRLVIIDGKSVFYRGYYAMPNLSTADGTPTGGVYGFAALGIELIKRLEPDYVCVAWDKPKTNIRKRLEIYPEYKAGRKPAPADFYAQIPILHELLEALGWPLYELDDYEADDIMATLARKAAEQGIETCLITSDLDALQVVGPLTSLYALKKGLTNIDWFDPAAFKDRYGLDVSQFLDLKSLQGDSSDNIPGVPGVGEKTAVSLLQQFDSLDGVYENLWQVKDALRKKLVAGKESAYMSRQVAELWFDAPVELDLQATDVKNIDTARLRSVLNRLEFRSLVNRLPGYMQGGGSDVKQSQISQISKTLSSSEIASAKQLVVYLDDDGKLWISHNRSKIAELSIENAMKHLPGRPIVGHDLKILLKFLLSNGASRLPIVQHDIVQGSFLLNSLRKSRALADLAGLEEINDAKQAVSAIWAIYDEQSQAFDGLPAIKHIAQAMDFPLVEILARMEHRGIRLDIDKLSEMDKSLTKQLTDIEQQIYKLVGKQFNVASPKQLSDILFQQLKLPTAGIKKGKTGYSTGQKELDKLRGKHPIVELIEHFREYSKLQNTYVHALPELVDSESRIHTTFNQDVASTGRLSSTDPNLQNIPIRTDLGRKIRDAFVPSEGYVFVSADYSQFELRLAAVLSGETKMINDFNAGTDIHAKTASEVYKVPLDNVTKEQRRHAKVINFGVLYGMSQSGLAAATGMSYADAQKFIDEYFRIRPKLKAYADSVIQKAHDDGYVETLFGRRRWTPDVQSSNFVVRMAAERAAANMPIQGTEADLMKLAMIEIERRLRSKSESEPLGYQILQIHDSIMVEALPENIDKVEQLLVDVMENIYPEIGIRLQVDVKIGKNWGEL